MFYTLDQATRGLDGKAPRWLLQYVDEEGDESGFEVTAVENWREVFAHAMAKLGSDVDGRPVQFVRVFGSPSEVEQPYRAWFTYDRRQHKTLAFAVVNQDRFREAVRLAQSS